MPAAALPPTNSLLRHRWALIIRGLLAIAFGVLSVVLPHVTILVVIALFAAPRRSRCGMSSRARGRFVAAWPALGTVAIVGVIAGFAIFLGILLVAAGVREWRLRRYVLGPPAREAV